MVRSTIWATCISSATSQVTPMAWWPSAVNPLGRTAERVLIDVGEHYGGTRLGESLHARQPDAGACTSDQGNLAAEVINRIHRLVPWFLRIVI